MKTLLIFGLIINSLNSFASNSNRSKQIDFEDNVVEGMNKNPLDFLENVAKKDGKGNIPLYKKRTNFRNELRSNAHEMGYVP